MPGLWCELFLRCRGCGGRGLWVLIPIFSPPPSGFFLQGFEGCRRRTLLWGGVHWSNPWVHWSNPLLSGSTPGVWVISPNFSPRTCCRAHRARSSFATYLLTTSVFSCMVLNSTSVLLLTPWGPLLEHGAKNALPAAPGSTTPKNHHFKPSSDFRRGEGVHSSWV